ncbi:MAG: acyl-CoA dehydrogenase family protein [Deltaproteobacteria bacterium]|nr:acyl-CoA dehydrogenase family protein [Deltaproteobacteria bacterium]
MINLDFNLLPKQRQIRRMVREFVRAELAPIAHEIDEEGCFPRESETKHKLRNISDEKCELLVTLYTP